MKPTLLMHLLLKQHGHGSVEQPLILSLQIFITVSGAGSYNFVAKDKTLSVPQKTVLSFLLCSPLLYLRLYGFCIKSIKSQIISGEIPWFVLFISLARIWRFFWCIVTLFYLLIMSHGKINLARNTNPILKLFRDFC